MRQADEAARAELLHGLFTTALEGGVQYWAHVDRYQWSTGDESTPDLSGFLAVLVEQENDRPWQVTRSVMARGLSLALSEVWRLRLAWSTTPPPLVLTADSIGAWDYDAGDADAVLQLGVFGDVVYG